MNKEIRISYDEITQPDELTGEEQELLMRARESAGQAYAPYSGFRVGAAVKLANGEIVTGNNQENAAYPSGLCAERVALFAASANFPGVPVESITVIATGRDGTMETPVSPCGSCRQVMAEYESRQTKPISILLAGTNNHALRLTGVESILPFIFNHNSL